MGQYSFRSVGKTSEQQKINNDAVATTPIMFGVKTPLREGINNIFDTTTSLVDQVGDNLRNLLQTNHGERLMLYDYGANLRPVVTEWVSEDDFDAEAIKRIKLAASKWMPYISLRDFSSSVDRSRNTGKIATVTILVTYDIPQLNTLNKAVEVTLFVP